jgi:hypothetical protein
MRRTKVVREVRTGRHRCRELLLSHDSERGAAQIHVFRSFLFATEFTRPRGADAFIQSAVRTDRTPRLTSGSQPCGLFGFLDLLLRYRNKMMGPRPNQRRAETMASSKPRRLYAITELPIPASPITRSPSLNRLSVASLTRFSLCDTWSEQ